MAARRTLPTFLGHTIWLSLDIFTGETGRATPKTLQYAPQHSTTCTTCARAILSLISFREFLALRAREPNRPARPHARVLLRIGTRVHTSYDRLLKIPDGVSC